jgi:Ca2+-binding RTX toxin-like protein
MHKLRRTPAALAGVSFVGALASTVVSSALAVGSPVAAQAATAASVSSSPTLGVRFFGSAGPDKVVLSRAGTPDAPLVVFDTAGPITIGANCRPAVGDPTTAICAAPIEAGSVLRRIFISSGGGDDVIAHGASLPIPLDVNTGPGKDVVNGGPGMDLIAGGSEDDLLRGGAGTDQIAGWTGNDVLEGGPGYGDGLNGGPGDDRLFGGEGDHDNLDGGVGADQIDGGPGDNDTIVYQYRTADVTVRLGINSENNGEANENDVIKGEIEHILGGAGNDKLVGDDGENTLIGRAGNDTLSGRKDRDFLLGGDGDDLLTGNTLPAEPGPNADGALDFIEGEAGSDICLRSPADDDSATTCEAVVNQN